MSHWAAARGRRPNLKGMASQLGVGVAKWVGVAAGMEVLVHRPEHWRLDAALGREADGAAVVQAAFHQHIPGGRAGH